jgi:COMM domain containing 7
MKKTFRSHILILIVGMREGWSAEQLEISASSLGLTERTGLAMRESWQLHSNELTSSLLSKIVSANQLVDVDWSFGVTASTEDCDKVENPIFFLL